MDLFRKCLDPVVKCIYDSKMDKGLVDDVVLVGGSSRIPMIQDLLQVNNRTYEFRICNAKSDRGL
jgi:L1 cell adhesion molecule like protein